MSTNETPNIELFPIWATNEVQPSVERFSKLPTPEDMRKRSLFGIPLRSAFTNQEITDDVLEQYLKEAISEIEHVLDLYITPVKFYEKHDYERHDFTWNYNYIKLNHPNVLHVSKIEVSFTNSVQTPGFINFPMEFVHLMPQEGVVQLVPAFGTSLSGFLLSAFSGTQYHALRAIGIDNFPGGIRIEYTAGFDICKVPALLVGLIEKIAAYKLLSTIGPVIFPYNSVSVGIDGTSQSSSSLGPNFLKGRLTELDALIQKEMDAAKGYYQRRVLIDFI
jgi:hypothetical protein